jgi:hypothetical protein
MREGKWKLLSNPSGLRPWNRPYARVPGSGFSLARVELYDLEADPLETRNLADAEPETVRRLTSKLEQWLSRALASEGVSDAPSEATLQQLRELGYIDGR